MVLNGDCLIELKKLPSNSIDAVITDPPYCSGGFNEAQKKNAKGQGLRSETIDKVGWFPNDNMSTLGLVWLLREVMIECDRLMTDGASALIFTDWRMVCHLAPAIESSGLQFRNLLVWDKGSIGLGNGFRPQHEFIMHFVKGSGNFYTKSVGNVLKSKRVNYIGRLHQTQKPVDLLSQLIEVVTKEGDTILDPFYGSGSTGEAAIMLNRNIIGVEKSSIHYGTAKTRTEKTISEKSQNLFAV